MKTDELRPGDEVDMVIRYPAVVKEVEPQMGAARIEFEGTRQESFLGTQFLEPRRIEDEDKKLEPPLVCPKCGNDDDFWAIGTAVYTAYLDGSGESHDGKDYDHDETKPYTSVTCNRCSELVAEKMPYQG